MREAQNQQRDIQRKRFVFDGSSSGGGGDVPGGFLFQSDTAIELHFPFYVTLEERAKRRCVKKKKKFLFLGDVWTLHDPCVVVVVASL